MDSRPAQESAPNPQLRIYLLGEPRVIDVATNEAVTIPARSMTLMAYLLLNRKTRLRGTIATALWPDLSDRDARANVRRNLFLLVRALPPSGAQPWVIVEGQRLQWNPFAPAWCDVDAFERSSRHDARCEAADSYGGELLPGYDCDWIIEQRNRLREEHCALLRALADARLRSGDSGGAALSLRRLLAIDPFSEDAFRSLFVLRNAAGDRAGATSEYRAFVRMLDVELGVAPMPETIACYESVVG